MDGDELRIVLLGKTGVGKSAVGNTILGEKVFKESSQKRKITFCQKEENVINGRRIVVIDTPGIFDTDLSEEEHKKEIISCMEKCEPGPHVFIVVLGVDRCTQENQQTVENLLKYFSGDVVHHMVLLFTHGEDLKQNMTIQDFINQSDVEGKKSGIQSLKDLAERCGNRVHVVDKKHWNDNSSDLDVLARLKQLNLPEQDIQKIADQMQLTPADKTPWFKTLTDTGGKVEAEDESEEESRREYRTNRFQITQLMKRIKTILRDNNGQHYRIKILMEAKDTVDRYSALTHFSKIPKMDGGDELRIVLLGKTGVGKSSVGNTILGEKVFKAECSPEGGTQICERAEKVINGRRIAVIDTPGIFDTNRPEEEVKKEIISCLVECAPGPHVFIIVLQVVRHTQENQRALEKLLELFTGDAVHHMVLLFTHGELLGENMTIQDHIHHCDVHNKSEKQYLKGLVERCGNRVHVVDNKFWDENSRVSAVLASLQGLNLSEQALREITEKILQTPGEQTPWFNVLSEQFVESEYQNISDNMKKYQTNRYQLTQLMKSIKHILRENKGQHYSNETLEEIGKSIDEEVEKILKEVGVKRERVDMVEIRKRARERVGTKKHCLI